MNTNGMSGRYRFLLVVVACAVLPLVIVSVIAFHGLMSYNMTAQMYLNDAQELFEDPSRTDASLSATLANMERELVSLSRSIRKLIIVSSLISLLVIVVVCMLLARTIKEVNIQEEYRAAESSAEDTSSEFEAHLKKMSEKLGNLVDENKNSHQT